MTARIARGDRVARATDSTQHVARVIQRDGLVACLCGNVIVRPRRVGLTGTDCPVCVAVERKSEWC